MDKIKFAVITGCDSGIGECLCRILADNNYKVIISYLNKNPFIKNKNVYAKKMDLKKEKEIASFVKFIKSIIDKKNSFELFINNAGVALGGPIENIPMKLYKDVFEINFFGLISITQKIIPILIKNKGKIINIGSMAGLIALPFLSPYVSSKFALEGFTDSLRRELNPLGIKTILLEPGGVNTPIWTKAKKQDISFADKKYLASLKSFEKNFIDNSASAMDPDSAAKQIFKIIKKKNPKDRYIIAKNRLTTFLPLLIPKKIFDKIVVKLFNMKY